MTTIKVINDCFNLDGRKIYNGEKLIQGSECGHNMIELENGIWLKDMCDGRLYTNDNENERWATVTLSLYNDDDEIIQTLDFLGYTKV